jgi:hypothetical protein
MRILHYFSILLLMLIIGCSDQSETATTEQAATPKAPEPESYDFAVITEGNTSGIQESVTSIYKLDTSESLQHFWQTHYQNTDPKPPMPAIDFDKSMIIAIVDTDQPSSGYQLTIERLQAVDDRLYIFAERTQPGPGCVSLGMISQPYVIIQTPKLDLIPELRLSTNTIPCE